MQLSVMHQTHDAREAAELAYSKRAYYLRYIKNQLKLKHINEDYVRAYAEDVLHSGIEILLTSEYDCANADEAIVESMTRAVQEVVRTLSKRREIAETVTYTTNKDGDKEVSRFDLAGGTASAEQVLLETEETSYTLQEAIEMAEAVRYHYGFDVVLNTLLRVGVLKGMWSESTVNGLLLAFESVVPTQKYHGDTCIARVVSIAATVTPEELIQTMRQNLSRCDVMFEALGYNLDAN